MLPSTTRARTYNPNGGRSGSTSSAGTATRSNSDGYYARPSNGSSRGSYYYDNSSSGNGRSGNSARQRRLPTTAIRAKHYYARPRESSRGSYTPSTGNSGLQQWRTGQLSAGSTKLPAAFVSKPEPGQLPAVTAQLSAVQPSYSAPSRSYSAPSYSGGGGAPRWWWSTQVVVADVVHDSILNYN